MTTPEMLTQALTQSSRTRLFRMNARIRYACAAGFRRTTVLPQLDGLQPHHFEQRQEHANQRLARFDVAQHCFNRIGRSSIDKRRQVLDHLPDVTASSSLESWPVAHPVDDLLKVLTR